MQAHLALVERPWADLPEARGPGSRFISRGEPGENWNLRFKFYDGGDAAAAYREPTGKPGLAAWAVINLKPAVSCPSGFSPRVSDVTGSCFPPSSYTCQILSPGAGDRRLAASIMVRRLGLSREV